MESRNKLIKEYYQRIKQVNLEQPKKELFKDLLIRLFDNDVEAKRIINKMSLGSEKTVFNIPLKNRDKTGSADTQYNNVIIEFENDLRKTGEHAKEQLTEYLAGNWKSGNEYNFILIATDCLNWKIYSVSYEDLLESTGIFIDNIKLRETDDFILNETNGDDFYFFLDRYIFRTNKIPATLDNIENDFGDTSPTFITVIGIMKEYFDRVKETGEVRTAYEQWNKFLSIAYGSFSASDEIFLVHTYLSVFSKMLAYTVITHDDFIDDEELKDILKGDIFERLNVQNFIDNDFYHWVAMDENLKALKPAFRKIAQQISQYDFTNVSEDILKGVYQELIDLETRHALGEYYTPDWLCEKIVEQFDFKKNSRILDPACGSGSFLRAAIAKLKNKFPDITADELAKNVAGIDIHPLSVQIAKTTVLLALGEKVKHLKKPVQLQIYLANTIDVPDGTLGLFGEQYNMSIDKSIYSISNKVFDDALLFDTAIGICDKLAEDSKNKNPHTVEFLQSTIAKSYRNGGLTADTVESFYKIYIAIKQAKETYRDSIWKFILQNLYKPFFLKERFDFVIGNPPWFTYSDIKNKDYQNKLMQKAVKYKVIPDEVANFPHLEIAAIFLAHASSYFLNKEGQIAFVLPRSFFSADHHDNTRSGEAKGFKITEIWDLKDVIPLFNIPSCVLFADKSNREHNSIAKHGVDGMLVSGKTKSANVHWKESKDSFKFEKTKWYYSTLRTRSAFTNKQMQETVKVNRYIEHFKQGATIVPRNFYFIEITQDYRGDLKDRILTVKSANGNLKDGKEPWKNLTISGRINTNYLFRTAIAKNIVPFGLINPPLVLLPIEIVTDKTKKTEDKVKRIKLVNWEKLGESGEYQMSDWFKKVETLWNKYKTERSKAMTYLKRLDFQKGITEQNLNKRYLVIYTASAKDANAVVIDREKLDLEFIVESKAYVFYTDNRNEAFYLCCFLNSSIPNQMIKAFQSRGLFGPRDIHKKILEVPLETYDSKNKEHQHLAELGKQCSEKISKHISENVGEEYNVGLLRREVKNVIKKEMNEVDKLVKEMI